eukprot:c12409_g1_i1.p1 GENE.c12409_g1_i1~~c12409_g1_i1.p1  ORF type:complete len:274 (+),score=56.39 c12409_g1_i1:60-824(+)
MGCCMSSDKSELKQSLLETTHEAHGFSNKPHLVYFAIRGRGEAIRLALEFAGCEYTDSGQAGGVDYTAMKETAGSVSFPCGQVPALVDGELVVSQTDAIMRHIGRRYGFCGRNPVEMAIVDMVLGAVESIRLVYTKLCYEHSFSQAAKDSYAALHILPEGVSQQNGGAHFQYLENFLKRNSSSLYIVGSGLTVADLQVFDIVDLHLRHDGFPLLVRQRYPLLVAHHQGIAALPQIARYLGSTRRLQMVNGNNLG